jgi:hypothetical protein
VLVSSDSQQVEAVDLPTLHRHRLARISTALELLGSLRAKHVSCLPVAGYLRHTRKRCDKPDKEQTPVDWTPGSLQGTSRTSIQSSKIGPSRASYSSWFVVVLTYIEMSWNFSEILTDVLLVIL